MIMTSLENNQCFSVYSQDFATLIQSLNESRFFFWLFFETMSWIHVRIKNDSIKNAREMPCILNCLEAASASTHKLDFGDVGK